MEDPIAAKKWRVEKTEGPPQPLGSLVVRQRAATVALVTSWGGFVFNTPLGIVIDDGRSEQAYQVVDYTRFMMLFLGCLSVTAVLLSRLFRQRITTNSLTIEDKHV